MAILTKNILGNLSGKVGSVVYRNCGGRIIVATLPARFKASQSKACVAIRAKFGSTVYFCTTVFAHRLFKSIWNNNRQKSDSGWIQFLKKNLNLSGSEQPGMNNIITPENGFYLKIINAQRTLQDLNLTIKTEVYEDIPSEAKVVFFVLFRSYAPKIEKYPPSYCELVVYVTNKSRLNKETNISIPITDFIDQVIDNYNEHTAYIAAIVYDKNEKVISYSVTDAVGF